MDNKSADAIVANSEKPGVPASHAGVGGAHGGQHSGGMGGERGGDLHDVGSGQSGMTGRGGMAGNELGDDIPAQQGSGAQGVAGTGNDDDDDGDDDGDGDGDALTDGAEDAPLQQSAPREGFGHHRRDS